VLHWQGVYQLWVLESSEMFPTNACKFLPIRTLLVPVLMPVLVPVAVVENDGLDLHFVSHFLTAV
jgi:hypothetical protein